MLANASYFAFTATPKNKTLEIFGEPYPGGRRRQAPALPQLHDEAGDPGRLHPRRAAELHAGRRATTGWSRRSRTTRSSTRRRRRRSCARYVESHDHAIRQKAEIMVDHFHEQVIAQQQDRRRRRGRWSSPAASQRAIQYYHAVQRLPAGAQEPVPGDRRLLRRARVRRRRR